MVQKKQQLKTNSSKTTITAYAPVQSAIDCRSIPVCSSGEQEHHLKQNQDYFFYRSRTTDPHTVQCTLPSLDSKPVIHSLNRHASTGSVKSTFRMIG